METSVSQATTTSVPGRKPRRAPVLAVFFLMGAELFLIPPMLGVVGESFGTGHAATAWAVTAYVVAYAASTPFLGAIGDRFVRRTVVTTGAFLFSAGVAGCAAAPTLAVLLATHAVAGLGGALAAPAIWAYLAETAAPEARGRAVAAGAAAYNGGQILGVPLGALVAATIGWRWAFAVVAVGVAACAVWARTAMDDDRHTAGGATAREGLEASFGLWRNLLFRRTVLATTLSQAARLGAYTYVAAVFAPRFGLDVLQLGLVGGGVGVGSLLGALAAGPAVDRWRSRGGHPHTLAALWGVVLAGAIAVSLTAGSLWLAVVALAVWFAAGGAFYSTGQAVLAEAVPAQRPAAVSWNNAAMNAGVAVGSAGLGLLSAGSAGFWLAAAGLAVLASLVSAATARRRP